MCPAKPGIDYIAGYINNVLARYCSPGKQRLDENENKVVYFGGLVISGNKCLLVVDRCNNKG